MFQATILFLLLPLQAAPASSQKISTPEQLAYRQQLAVYNAEVEKLRASGTTHYKAEISREAVQACPNADNTIAINLCLSHEDDITAANYKAFLAALRAILALPRPRGPGEPIISYGPSGPAATPATSLPAFDRAETAWQSYAKAECDAVDVEWRSGTIVNAMDLGCSLRLARSRLRELYAAYEARVGDQ